MFSELELALEVKKKRYHRVAVSRPDNKQNCCRTVEEYEELCLRRGLNCYQEDVKKNRGNSLALQTQNFSYTDPFLLDRLLEIEGKCYLFHTLPT